MMLIGAKLRVVPVTGHIALRQSSAQSNAGQYSNHAGADATQSARIFSPLRGRASRWRRSIPHGGEQGIFGDEEIEIIAPAVQAARKQGVGAFGPFPADSLFHHAARGDYDAVVCMYHDQGLIPLKLHHFYGGVALTLGPPFIRTSVDHGTAYDIAGKGKADETQHERSDFVGGAFGAPKFAAEEVMNPSMFREYDIRGLAEKDFDQEFALLLGKVHGTVIAEKGGTRVTVGRDCRATSDPYAEAVIAGLASAGLAGLRHRHLSDAAALFFFVPSRCRRRH